MSTKHNPNMTRPGDGRKRLGLTALAFLLAVLLPAQAFADNGALYRSILLPGAGQAHKGHYKKAAIFAGATVLTAAGVFLTQIHYNQAADRYNNEQRAYNAYQTTLDNGGIVSVTDMNSTYAAMQSSWNDSEDRLTTRNIFLSALLVTYAWNIVDVLVTEPHRVDPDEQEESRYSIEADGRQVRFAAKFGF